MITDFPVPYEDEILYSLIARYHRHSGNLYERYSIEQLFGNKVVQSSNILPKNLGYMAIQLQRYGFDLEKLILDYTLYPYCMVYSNKEKCKIVWKWAENNEKGSIGFKVNNGDKQKKYMMFCSECFKEDLKNYGEAYWHRMHQTPGIIICDKHNCRLNSSRIPINSELYKGYKALNENIIYPMKQIEEYSDEIIKHAKQMNKDILYVYKNFKVLQNEFWDNGNALYKKFLYFAKENGYLTERNQLRQNEFLLDFYNFFSKQYLIEINELPTENKPWTIKMFQKRKPVISIKKYILMAQFFVGSFEKFINIKANCDIDRTRKIYNIPSEYQEKLKIYHERFEIAFKNSIDKSRSSVRKNDDPAYQWLMRHDKDWFENHFDNELSRVGNKSNIVNWNEIDDKVNKEISKIITKEYNSSKKPKRITKNFIFREIKLYKINAKNISKCPVSERTLNNLIESTDHFQLRRVKYWKNILAKDGIDTEWIIYKKAGISSLDIPKIRALLERENKFEINSIG